MTHPKHATADHEILDVIRERWSPRAFDGSRAVPRADLLRLLEAARWAPSSRNEQPWRFIVADRTTDPAAYAAFAATLTGRNPEWATTAPVLILVCVRLTYQADAADNRMALYDAGQAVAFLTLQSTAMGLAVRQMEGFDRARAGEAARVPEPFAPVVMMAVGYRGQAEALAYDKHRLAETMPRARRPIAEFVFRGTWGTEMPT
jgi:nitroreductase